MPYPENFNFSVPKGIYVTVNGVPPKGKATYAPLSPWVAWLRTTQTDFILPMKEVK